MDTGDMKKLSDEELAELTKNDSEFFGIIIDRYEKKLKRYIERISSSGFESEDILSEVFISSYQKIESYNKEMKFSSWIYAIARNKTISWWRKNKKYSDHLSVEDNKNFIENFFFENNLVSNLENKELKEKINNAFLKVKEKYREVLILKFLEDKSYEEISDILKLPKGTVSTYITRGKKELIKLIKKQHERF